MAIWTEGEEGQARFDVRPGDGGPPTASFEGGHCPPEQGQVQSDRLSSRLKAPGWNYRPKMINFGQSSKTRAEYQTLQSVKSERACFLKRCFCKSLECRLFKVLRGLPRTFRPVSGRWSHAHPGKASLRSEVPGSELERRGRQQVCAQMEVQAGRRAAQWREGRGAPPTAQAE